MKDTFPYSSQADTQDMKARERELYRMLNPKGPKNGMELRVIGWVRVDTRMLKDDEGASLIAPTTWVNWK